MFFLVTYFKYWYIFAYPLYRFLFVIYIVIFVANSARGGVISPPLINFREVSTWMTYVR